VGRVYYLSYALSDLCSQQKKKTRKKRKCRKIRVARSTDLGSDNTKIAQKMRKVLGKVVEVYIFGSDILSKPLGGIEAKK